jgi:4-amino-4-deoxy-L-arabinose transferase-like glycosyltransferase
MKVITSNITHRLLLTVVIVILLIGFTPISTRLLHYVNGSFAPSPYSSLQFTSPSVATTGVATGFTISVKLTNHTGRATTYHWTATQGEVMISRGGRTLANNTSTLFYVTTPGAVAGRLRIALDNTKIFITVPIFTSVS